LNPGPKILPSRLYMLSSRFRSRTRLSPGTGDCQVPACLKSRRSGNRHTQPASPKSRRFTPPLRARSGEAAKQTMLPLRNYNRQRLYLRFHQVYELTEHSACNVELTYPRRIRFTPMLLFSEAVLQSFLRNARCRSRLDCFSFKAARLSYNFLPRARPSSTLALPL